MTHIKLITDELLSSIINIIIILSLYPNNMRDSTRHFPQGNNESQNNKKSPRAAYIKSFLVHDIIPARLEGCQIK